MTGCVCCCLIKPAQLLPPLLLPGARTQDRCLLTVGASAMVSCLTWVQLAKAKVLMYPYHPALAVLAAAITAGEDG